MTSRKKKKQTGWWYDFQACKMSGGSMKKSRMWSGLPSPLPSSGASKSKQGDSSSSSGGSRKLLWYKKNEQENQVNQSVIYMRESRTRSFPGSHVQMSFLLCGSNNRIQRVPKGLAWGEGGRCWQKGHHQTIHYSIWELHTCCRLGHLTFIFYCLSPGSPVLLT